MLPDRPHRPALARWAATLAFALLALPLLAPAAAGQQVDAVLRGFQPTGDLIVVIDGTEAPTAELYKADPVPAFLILADQLPGPLFVLPRERSVQTTSFMKVLKRKDGVVDVLADAELTRVGGFNFQGDEVSFQVDGRSVVLKPRPDLLGEQGVDEMLAYSPEYRRTAKSYTPAASDLKTLEGVSKPVKVRVYFGSWCPFCKQYVPHLLKVAEELDNGNMEFEFYGLPQGFGGEPMAERDSITGVPTGIVYVDGKEVGRIQSNDWRRPEDTLVRLVTGS